MVSLIEGTIYTQTLIKKFNCYREMKFLVPTRDILSLLEPKVYPHLTHNDNGMRPVFFPFIPLTFSKRVDYILLYNQCIR
jgi:hypothetical protein